jgi:hypothetical protein
MVGRETLFRFLPARRYYVQVHGLLQDPASDLVVGNYFEEQPVEVKRGRSARVDFDFRPRECALEVSVFRGREPVAKAIAALRGQPESVRYVRGGRTLFYVGPGVHRVLLGVDDRVCEREIRIEDYTPRTLGCDVEDSSALLFSGSREAVEPYLQGHLLAAAEALERAGAAADAARVRGEHHALHGETAEAARCFQQAGRYEEAASLVSRDAEGDAGAAAELYE